jgi:glycosyltransferase involved in cell wall biosynthesis
MKPAQSEVVRLSIVVASLDCRALLKDCLDAILANEQKGVEIIVADCCLKNDNLASEYPSVNFLRFPAKTSLPVLLAAGIARTKNEIVAVTDSTCIVAEDWVAAILKAHDETDAPVIGGAVEMLAAKSDLTEWAAYFCDYGQFMLPAPRGVVDAVSGNNFSFKKWALHCGEGFTANEFWKTHWCRRLQAEGFELFSEPTILVRVRKNYKFGNFLIRRFNHGRCFAAMRVAKEKFSARAVYAGGSILLPVLFLFRTISPLLTKKRFIGKLLLSFPTIVLAIVFWSFGETIGYLAGAGRSCERID